MFFSGSPIPPAPRAVEYSRRTILLEVCVSKLIVRPFFGYLEWKSKHLILPPANQESLFSVMRLSHGLNWLLRIWCVISAVSRHHAAWLLQSRIRNFAPRQPIVATHKRLSQPKMAKFDDESISSIFPFLRVKVHCEKFETASAIKYSGVKLFEHWCWSGIADHFMQLMALSVNQADYLLNTFELTAVLSAFFLCSFDVITQVNTASAPFSVVGIVRIVVWLWDVFW